MPATLTIWLASDAHCTKVGNPDYLPENANSIPIYTAFKDLANAAAPDAVFTLGDLAASPDSLSDATAIATAISNHHAVIGNHDISETGYVHSAAYWKPLVAEAYAMPATYYAFTLDFMRCVVLDTHFSLAGEDAVTWTGFLPAWEQAWLTSQLAGNQKATLILCHHGAQNRSAEGGTSMFSPVSLHRLFHLTQQYRNVYIGCGHRHPASNVTLGLSTGSGVIVAPLVDRDPGTGLAYTVATIVLGDDETVTVTMEQQAIVL